MAYSKLFNPPMGALAAQNPLSPFKDALLPPLNPNNVATITTPSPRFLYVLEQQYSDLAERAASIRQGRAKCEEARRL